MPRETLASLRKKLAAADRRAGTMEQAFKQSEQELASLREAYDQFAKQEATRLNADGVKHLANGQPVVVETPECPLYFAEAFSVGYGEADTIKVNALRLFPDGSHRTSCVMALPLSTAKALGLVIAETVKQHEARRGTVGLNAGQRAAVNSSYSDAVKRIASEPLTY